MGAATDELVGEVAHQRAGLALGLRRLDLGDGLSPRLGGGQFRGPAEGDVGRPELADDADEIRPRIVVGDREAEGGQRMVQHGQRTLAVLPFPETSAGGPVVDGGVDAHGAVSRSVPSDAVPFRGNKDGSLGKTTGTARGIAGRARLRLTT